MRCIDLFCGAGGSSLGAKLAGHEVVLAVDDWETALSSHEANHPDTEHWLMDVRKITPEMLKPYKADILTGSPPCQSFSDGNSFSIGRYNERRLDTDLISAFLALAKSFRYYCMENVRRAVPDGELYPFQPKMLNACDFFVPQFRRRLFVANFPLPESPNGKEGKRKTDEISPCVTATELKGSANDVRRRFTTWFLRKYGRKPDDRDMAKYMGFPDDYIFSGNKAERGTQIGNAIPPPMMKAVLEGLKRT